MAKVQSGLLYAESHEWVKVDGNIAIVGVSDHAQDEMGDITYIELPEEGDEFSAGGEAVVLESVKASGEVFAPVSGKVIAINSELEDKPEAINEDAYAAWLIKIEMSDASQLDSLMKAEEYSAAGYGQLV